jgi:hypothetical protein
MTEAERRADRIAKNKVIDAHVAEAHKKMEYIKTIRNTVRAQRAFQELLRCFPPAIQQELISLWRQML